jgi:hypothetical protein
MGGVTEKYNQEIPKGLSAGLEPNQIASEHQSRTPTSITQHCCPFHKVLNNTLCKCLHFMHLIVRSLQAVLSRLVREPRPIIYIFILLDHQHLAGIAPPPHILYHHKFHHTPYCHYFLHVAASSKHAACCMPLRLLASEGLLMSTFHEACLTRYIN